MLALAGRNIKDSSDAFFSVLLQADVEPLCEHILPCVRCLMTCPVAAKIAIQCGTQGHLVMDRGHSIHQEQQLVRYLISEKREESTVDVTMSAITET